MNIFERYADYYDLLYEDKDYVGEAAYIERLIKEYQPGAKTILDLGCGTGRHDFFMAEKGYSVTGVDRSEHMLEVALSRQRREGLASGTLEFMLGDMRTIRLDRDFDVVLCLFHVMSYQAENDDILSSLRTVKDHLRPGGLFIFDCWYGPAVLAHKPVTRIKRMISENMAITRIAEPVLHHLDNTVDVNYHVFVRDEANGQVDELKEKHTMRYLFKPEVDHYVMTCGLRVVDVFEWMTGSEPGLATWSACFVVRG